MDFDYIELPVGTPLAITSAQAVGGQATLKVDGPAGPDYTLLISTDLTQWSPVLTSPSPMPPVFLVDTNRYPPGLLFYRIRLDD